MPSAVWKPHTNPAHLYFVTTRAIGGQHVFHRDVIKRIIIDCLHIGRLLHRFRLYTFVVMPNHLHCILQPSEEAKVSDVVRDMKKAMSNMIVRHFEAEDNQRALALCAAAVSDPAKQQHAIWEDEYQAQNVYSAEFLMQKLNYIHNNPLQPRWNLAETATAYPWSSAAYYLEDRRPIIPLDDVRKLLQ